MDEDNFAAIMGECPRVSQLFCPSPIFPGQTRLSRVPPLFIGGTLGQRVGGRDGRGEDVPPLDRLV